MRGLQNKELPHNEKVSSTDIVLCRYRLDRLGDGRDHRMKKLAVALAYLISIWAFHHNDAKFKSDIDEMINGSPYNSMETPAHGFMDWFYIRGAQTIDWIMYGYSRPTYDWVEDVVETKR